MRAARWTAIGLAATLSGATPALANCQLGRFGTLPVEMVALVPTTMVKINGQNTAFTLDTGAFFSIMSRANAAALGLKLEPAPYGFHISGVGGIADVSLTHVRDFGILGTSLHNIDFLVGGTDTGRGIIGANLLDFADLDIDLAAGKAALMKATGCGKVALAYWSKDGNYQTADLAYSGNPAIRKSFVRVVINGKEMRAELDTGAGATVLTRSAAHRAGIDLAAPAVKPSGVNFGFGAKAVKTWIARVDKIEIGTESIAHSQMQVLDGDLGEGADSPDMLLGVDFFLSHHIYIANSQGKIYFTYNGGRVFSLAKPGSGDAAAAVADSSDAPKTAQDFALRGHARLSRGEEAAALADFDAAIALDAKVADYFMGRAKARLLGLPRGADRAAPQAAARADLDAALALEPHNLDALLLRALQRFGANDKAGAGADVDAARALAPAGSPASLAIASDLEELHRPGDALPLLDDWIRLHGDDARLGNVLNTRCWMRGLANREIDGALADCHKAISRLGPHPGILDSLGLAQLRKGDYSGSIASYNAALAANPKLAWSLYGRGLAEIRSGHGDAGKADTAAAVALNPDLADNAKQYGLSPD